MGITRTAACLVPAVALITALASCGSGTTDSVGQQASAPSPTPTTEARESACAPDDIDVGFRPDVDGGATGEMSLVVRFTNHGSGTCVLTHRPTADFLDDAGRPVGLRYDPKLNQYFTGGIYKRAVQLQPRASVDVVIAKYRCDLGYQTTATEVKIGLSDVNMTTTRIIDEDLRRMSSCVGGKDDPGQVFGISGYTGATTDQS